MVQCLPHTSGAINRSVFPESAPIRHTGEVIRTTRGFPVASCKRSRIASHCGCGGSWVRIVSRVSTIALHVSKGTGRKEEERQCSAQFCPRFLLLLLPCAHAWHCPCEHTRYGPASTPGVTTDDLSHTGDVACSQREVKVGCTFGKEGPASRRMRRAGSSAGLHGRAIMPRGTVIRDAAVARRTGCLPYPARQQR